MKLGAHFQAILLMSVIVAPRCRASTLDDNPPTSHQLSLADLAGYRAALSGKPTADDARASDPPAQVKFKDLWNRPEIFRGRRITIQGRVARIFRQGSVGSFPPLAEIWITSPAGDPFCVVFPQPASTDDDHAETATSLQAVAGESALALEEKHGDAERAVAMPELGRTVRFTGTFLKMVSYAGGDGARLAPLVVGDRLPMPIAPKHAAGHSSPEGAGALAIGDTSHSGAALGPAYWALGLAVVALGAVILARWHLRAPARPAAGRRTPSPSIADPSLEFIEPHDEP
jgi:hypothetical protein